MSNAGPVPHGIKGIHDRGTRVENSLDVGRTWSEILEARMMHSQRLKQGRHGGVWGVWDSLSVAQSNQVSVQGSVDAIDTTRGARRLEKRFRV